jgi:hypothetical protein
MANDEEMFVLFEDFERQWRQFYHGQSPLQIHITENCFQKHFRLTKVLWNLLLIYKSQIRTSPMDIFLPFFLCEPR